MVAKLQISVFCVWGLLQSNRSPTLKMPPVKGRPRTTPRAATRSTTDELARRLKGGLTVITPRFSWHALYPIAEEDHRQYLTDPVAALPPAVIDLLPRIGIVLAPYLERPAAKGAVEVVEKKPAEPKLVLSTRVVNDELAMLFFTTRGEQVADYHYFLFDEIAALLSQRWPDEVQENWHRLLREELSAEVHGEVDDRSWRLKQGLLRRPMAARKDGKPFRDYTRESFRDTVTLYLHGICCDIDVEAGPRQLPSRYLRKRLESLKSLFPPPPEHYVFPEDVPRS